MKESQYHPEDFAGGALYHRKPKQAPTTEPQKIDNSPTSGIY